MARATLFLLLLLAGTPPAISRNRAKFVSGSIKATGEFASNAVHAVGNVVSNILDFDDDQRSTPQQPRAQPAERQPSAPLPPAPAAHQRRKRGNAREFLSGHNQVRTAFGESPLTWDKNLVRYARRWADYLKTNNSCKMKHSSGPYGENLFYGSGYDFTATAALQEWAAEKLDYHLENNSCSPGKVCGHFTQLVWKSTERVGCARVQCDRGGIIVACSYDPPGNFEGERPY